VSWHAQADLRDQHEPGRLHRGRAWRHRLLPGGRRGVPVTHRVAAVRGHVPLWAAAVRSHGPLGDRRHARDAVRPHGRVRDRLAVSRQGRLLHDADRRADRKHPDGTPPRPGGSARAQGLGQQRTGDRSPSTSSCTLQIRIWWVSRTRSTSPLLRVSDAGSPRRTAPWSAGHGSPRESG